MRAALLLLWAFNVVMSAQMLPWQMAPEDLDKTALPGLRIIDARKVWFDEPSFTEISALAYDGKTEMLFAVSDRGMLQTLKLDYNASALLSLELLQSLPLRNKNGEPYEGKRADAEGMDLTPDGRLLVSFERKPRILYFDKQGRKLAKAEVAKPLRDIKNYRGKNKALEAVALHPKYGVITVPERPLKSGKKGVHTLYTQAMRWHFNAVASVTAIEAMPGGDLLVLERDYTPLPPRQVITLQRVSLKECKGAFCPSGVVARFDSDAGWRLDNFEGLTHLRDNLYLMISDDNGSPLQHTLLVLLEIIQ